MSFYMLHDTLQLSRLIEGKVHDTKHSVVEVIGIEKGEHDQTDTFKIKGDIIKLHNDSFEYTSLRNLTLKFAQLDCEQLYLPNVEVLNLVLNYSDALTTIHDLSRCILNVKLRAPKLLCLILKHNYIDVELFDKTCLDYMFQHCKTLQVIRFDPYAKRICDTIDFQFRDGVVYDDLVNYADKCNTVSILHSYAEEGFGIDKNGHDFLIKVKELEKKCIKYGLISKESKLSLREIEETNEETFERLLSEYCDFLDLDDDLIKHEIDTIRKKFKSVGHIDLHTCYGFYTYFDALEECFDQFEKD